MTIYKKFQKRIDLVLAKNKRYRTALKRISVWGFNNEAFNQMRGRAGAALKAKTHRVKPPESAP